MPLPAETPRSGGTGNCAGKPMPVKIIRYKSNPGFIGTDTFSYKTVSDGITAPYDFTITVIAAGAASPLYLGCFKDPSHENKDPSHEDLGRDQALIHSNVLTGARCVTTCGTRGYRFAATQNGATCICGNVYGFSGAADNCNLPCSGDRAEACGGFNANSIYAANELLVEPASPPFVGTWMSNRGPYTFVAEGTQIRGWFQHGPGEKGSLTDGRYDPATRQLAIASNQEWNGERATLTLTLAPTGRTMTGTYQPSNGSGSPVAMQLALRGDPPSAAAARPHGMTVSNKPRIEVLPVLFIPSDATWVTQRDIDLYSYLILAQPYSAVARARGARKSSMNRDQCPAASPMWRRWE